MKSSLTALFLAVTSIANALPQAASAGCSALEIVVARGTGEPGSYGLIVGDPLVAAVKKGIPSATAYDIKYPADMSAASPDKGADAVVAYFASQPAKCPEQKYVIVGYSQGCVVQRRAMLKVPDAVQKRIVGVVTFGDPGLKSTTAPMGGPVPSWSSLLEKRFYTNCAGGDPVCDPKSGVNILQHLTYSTGDYMSKSAEFVKAQLAGNGVGGVSNAPPPLAAGAGGAAKGSTPAKPAGGMAGMNM